MAVRDVSDAELLTAMRLEEEFSMPLLVRKSTHRNDLSTGRVASLLIDTPKRVSFRSYCAPYYNNTVIESCHAFSFWDSADG